METGGNRRSGRIPNGVRVNRTDGERPSTISAKRLKKGLPAMSKREFRKIVQSGDDAFVSIAGICNAAQAGDLDRVRAILKQSPELARQRRRTGLSGHSLRGTGGPPGGGQAASGGRRQPDPVNLPGARVRYRYGPAPWAYRSGRSDGSVAVPADGRDRNRNPPLPSRRQG